MVSRVLVLVGHGSREPAARCALEQLGEQCAPLLPDYAIAIAELECVPEPLSLQLHHIQQQYPYAYLDVIPVFMGAGVHVQSDIPQAVAGLTGIRLHPPLGTWPTWVDVVARRCRNYPQPQAWILWGHGSRLAEFGAGLAAQALALQNALKYPIHLAFAMQAPTLPQMITAQWQAGYRDLGIVPCFWSQGALLTTLNNQCTELIATYPGLHCQVTDVLLPDPAWPIAIAERIRETAIQAASESW